MEEDAPDMTTNAAELALHRAQAEEREKKFSCRFYEKEYPDLEEVVMVNVKDIAEMGAYVTLLEYNNIEGMIMFSELSRRRIRSIHKLIRVGRNEAVMVLRVDKEKGYIDLSKRRVSPGVIAETEMKYNRAKTVHSILRQTAIKLNLELKFLYETVGWPLYREFGHAHDAFKLAVAQPERVFANVTIADDVREEIMTQIVRRLTPQPHRIRADIEVTCFAFEGIEGIKAALTAGQAAGTEEIPLKIKLIAPPLYVITTQSTEKELGIEVMNNAIRVIKDTIESKGGALSVKMEPRATSSRDETELSALMERLEAENAEVDGDTPEDDGGAGEGAAETA